MKAPRPPVRPWRRWARGALTGLVLWPVVSGGGAIHAQAQSQTQFQTPQQITAASYVGPTQRYDHLVLGRDHNWSGLKVTLTDGTGQSRTQTLTHRRAVFEDTAPRMVDLDGDGAPEVIVVESLAGQGARLAVYGMVDNTVSLLAATPHIGRGHRWLAPVGAADLDGDGHIEIAYVDRPHLAKTLRVWRFYPGDMPRLDHIADLAGLTNHRISDAVIEGGIRNCDGPPEMILASGDWSRAVAVRLTGAELTSRDLGTYAGAQDMADRLGCS